MPPGAAVAVDVTGVVAVEGLGWGRIGSVVAVDAGRLAFPGKVFGSRELDDWALIGVVGTWEREPLTEGGSVSVGRLAALFGGFVMGCEVSVES